MYHKIKQRFKKRLHFIFVSDLADNLLKNKSTNIFRVYTLWTWEMYDGTMGKKRKKYWDYPAIRFLQKWWHGRALIDSSDLEQALNEVSPWDSIHICVHMHTYK